ncbi:MAP/microtubule affinity-regulating kinase 3-like [Ochotona princeps]|uniref:MAP/microtubule affinity-regulating kinase 3-like n=1 Tax=Ochotona princeps TaxID=9978 RepID=UPI00271532F8|nr:MAP/microtubule affinity-regulating kinase 3-like [Ochotona princeps]
MEGQEHFLADANCQAELDFLSLLGEGTFGMVLLARHRPSGRKVAVKVAMDDRVNPNSSRELAQEASILSTLQHDHIIRLLQVCHVGHHLCVVLELAGGGNLWDHVMSHGGLEEDKARDLLRQILAAVEYCHEQHIAHRDLKLGNILLDSRLHVKVSDFGLSRRLPEGQMVSGYCGTPTYSAPEVFLERPYDPFQADIWSVGVILFTMVAAELPFHGQDTEQLRRSVLCGGYTMPFEVTPDLEDLLEWLLSWDASQRPTAAQVTQHTWFELCPEEEPEDKHDNEDKMTGVTPVQVLGVPEDLEALQYLADVGLLPASGEATSSPGLEAWSQRPGRLLPWERRSDWDSASRCSPPMLYRAPAFLDCREGHSEPGLPTSELLPLQDHKSSGAGPVLATPLPGQEQEEGQPSSSPALVPVPVAFPGTPSARSSETPAHAEAPEVVSEEPGPSAAASDQSRSRQGLCRRIGRRIIGFLRQVCCLGPAPNTGPGPRSRKVAPR